MELFIVRHGIAQNAGPGMRDADRALTREGREKFEKTARGLKQLAELDHIFHSPWRRAAQTAEILGRVFDISLTEHTGLAQPPTPEFFKELPDAQVALVGHEPWCSDMTTMMFCPQPQFASVEFKKGSVAWLRGPARPGEMTLRAFFTPRSLRAIASP